MQKAAPAFRGVGGISFITELEKMMLITRKFFNCKKIFSFFMKLITKNYIKLQKMQLIS